MHPIESHARRALVLAIFAGLTLVGCESARVDVGADADLTHRHDDHSHYDAVTLADAPPDRSSPLVPAGEMWGGVEQDP